MELQRHLAEIGAHGAVVIGASTEPVAAAKQGAHAMHLTFPLLQDTGHRLGLAFAHTVVAADVDTLLVLDADGRVRWRRPTGGTLVPATEVIAALDRG